MDASDDLALICGLAGLNTWETAVMEAAGWSVTRLATLQDCGRETLEAMVWRIQQRESEFAVSTDTLSELVRRAATRARTRHMWDAKRGSHELLEAHVAHQRSVRRRAFDEVVEDDVKKRIEMVGTAKRGRWPTRLSMKLHIASGDLAMRELAERQERDRWIVEIKEIVKRARLPVARRSSDEALMIRVAKGRRANTLRKHVKTWMKASRWIEATFGYSWPETPEAFAEFLEAMVEEPCAKSFPESVYKSLMFLEYAGEVPEADQICRAPAVKNALEEAALRLQSVELKPSRKALVLPVSVVISWEAHVCDENMPNYPRIYAWFRLVKLWTGMRFDDTKGTPNRTVEMLDYGLKGVIHRSKTSGPGKRVILLPFYISKEAWIVEKEWLLVGWRLWTAMGAESGMHTRDFMLPWPNKARDGFIRKVVDYPIASTMSQALFNELLARPGPEKKNLLGPGLGVLWTEHSERATVRTWAQAARVPEDVRRMLGRWRPSADEGYERNVKINVLRCQAVLALFIKENMSNADPFDETTVIQLVAQRMREMGSSQDDCDEQMMRLMSFMPGVGAAKPCNRPKWTTTGPVVLVEESEATVGVEQETTEQPVKDEQQGVEWPVGRRTAPSTEKGKELSRWCLKAFEDWVELEGEERAKKLFWETAGGKLGGTPFGGEIFGFRERLDLWLKERGVDPRRRTSDRKSEINFRRLRAVAQILEDEDWVFLSEVAAKGVSLGVDEEMPRNPLVFEEKQKWTVEPTEEDFHDTLADNYTSAEENATDIKRQVLEEVQKGTILRMSEEEAKKRFGGRLAVAAPGAVPKELGTTKVRLIHDGTYSVDVNRRIRVRDRVRFPLIDDAAAVLRQVEEEKREQQQVVRLSVLYDIARAHKLIPVREEDWGLQAFRLPGESTGDVFVHTRGTFGIASAAYWFGRTIGVVVRSCHRIMGRHMGLLHLIYADDGWLTATGPRFWKKILMWLFLYELLEIPITWAKVRGGAEVNWIGYYLNVSTFERGINNSKREWIQRWIEDKLEKGGVVGRELKSVLGRLSFVAGALRHVRPFLAPLFSWSSTLAGGTFASFPDAVIILLEFVREEVSRKPSRGLEPLSTSPTDIFRVDAKAAGEEIVIGGWETWRRSDPAAARWFSFRLNRKNAAWAYLKGDPFRSIATLELIGVLAAVMVLSPGAEWAAGDAAVTLSALTDNLGNTHVLRKFGSSKYPLSIVAMELATQLDRRGIELDLQWVPEPILANPLLLLGTPLGLQQSIYDYFGIALPDTILRAGLDYSNNHVFETSEIFSLFCRAQELRDAGDATVVYRKYTTLENRHWGIQAGKKIKVVFVWTEKTVKWELQLPDKTQAAINSGAYDSPGTAGFPYLGTFSPKPDGSDFTAVLPEQGNLYASLTEWSLRQNQEKLQKCMGA
eukprot:g26404.t1